MTRAKSQRQELTPAEKRAVPGAHYSAGRRWSRISKAWIFAEHWNDSEEAACQREERKALLVKYDAARANLLKLAKLLALIETVCLESEADLRKRGGSRIGNVLVTVRAARELVKGETK